jgi:adenosine deaminase
MTNSLDVPMPRPTWRAMALILVAALASACAPAQTIRTQPAAAAAAAGTAESLTAAYLDAVRHDPLRTLMFVQQMPKGADLHSHLSGAVYAESYIEWAAETGLCVDIATGGLVRGPCDAGAGRPPAAAALQSSSLYNR